MPTLICPHCQTPQAVSDEVYQKNLGKKCRCRQCQKTFIIEAQAPQPAAEPGGFGDFDFLNEDSPAPAPAAPPPAAAKTKAAAKPAPTAAPQPAPADELDFSGLMGGMGSVTVADLPDFASPEPSLPPVADAPEFPSFDDIAPAPEPAQAAAPKAKVPLTRLPQAVADDEDESPIAPQADRSALRFIATAFRFIGFIHLFVAAVGIAAILYVLVLGLSGKGGFGLNIIEAVLILFPWILFGASAVTWFAVSELIHVVICVEARLHEISRRIRSRS